MRFLDFSSWQGVLLTILGLSIIALVGVGIRVLVILLVQQRQQRMNRQINERLKTLMAAYRVLGGSFTGELTVNPQHLRDIRLAAREAADKAAGEAVSGGPETMPADPLSDRPRRIRDAVEAALSDILLLGTAEHVRLAGQAASDLAAGRPIHTAELVISLRQYIRHALDLDPIPAAVSIPLQGPTRPQAGSSRGGKSERGGGAGGGGGGAAAGGGGMGMGLGLGAGRGNDTP